MSADHISRSQCNGLCHVTLSHTYPGCAQAAPPHRSPQTHCKNVSKQRAEATHYTPLELDASYVKCVWRRAKALLTLQRPLEAREVAASALLDKERDIHHSARSSLPVSFLAGIRIMNTPKSP
jgi:hypothetical protein